MRETITTAENKSSKGIKCLLVAVLLVCVILFGMTQTVFASDGIVLDTRTETVTGVSNQMEYSTNGTRWTAITSNPLNISSMIPAATARADVALRIRNKASGGNPASSSTDIGLPRRPATPATTAVKFDGFSESITATDFLEYRVGSSGNFTSVTTGATGIPVSIGASYQSYQVRVKATDNAFASATRTVSVPARRAAPGAVYNGSTDRITGVTSAMEYSLNSGASWTAITGTYLTRSVFGDTATTVMIRSKATATAPSSNIKSVAIPGAATSSPDGILLDTYAETVIGVSKLMEYSINNSGRWTAIKSNTLSISSMIPAATAGSNVTLSIRIKAANGNPASLTANISLPRRPATPAVTAVRFDGFSESIIATDLMEYKAGSSVSFTSVATGATSIPVNSGTSAQSYRVRVKATDTAFASATRVISIPARKAAPGAVYNGSTDSITGVTSAMEYSLNSGTSWTAITGSYLTRSVFGDTAAIVMIRSKATASAQSSNIKSVTVPGAATFSPDGIALNTRTETVAGVTNLMEYSTNNGGRWTAITSNTLNIASLIPAATAGSDITLSIRLKSVSGNPASLPTNITLPKRPAAPAATSVRFDGITETILVNDSLEYRAGTSGDYTSVETGAKSLSVNVGASAWSYQIRVKATDTTFISAQSLTITVPARGAAPNAVYNGSTDSITGVTSAMEYSFDGGETWTSATTTTISRSVSGDAAVTVSVRARATETAPVSNTKIVSVPGAPTTFPTGFILDTFTETVAGVSDLMQYSVNGTTWSAITTDTLKVTSLISDSSDVTLRIRYASINGEPASLSTNLILPQRPAVPATTAVRFDGFTESILVSDLMEYRVGTAGSYLPVTSGATGISVSIGTSTQSYQVRVKATDVMFASSARAVLIPVRASAPFAIYDGAVDMITGVSSSMEYSLNGGTSWTPITSSSIQRNAFGDLAATVMIRGKATSATPSSNTRSVNVPGKGETFPTDLMLDTRNEAVAGVSNLMEYSLNGTTWITITGNTLDISNIIPAATATDGIFLSIRYRAASGSPASFAASVFIPRRPAAPESTAAKFDGITESVAATLLMEYRIGTTGNFSAVPAGDTRIPVAVGSASQSFQVRYRATDSAFTSATYTLTIPARATAPNAVFNSTQNVITGVSSTMEYSLNNGATWITVSGTTISRSTIGNAATIVLIRVKATSSMPFSLSKSVDVPKA